MHYVASDIHGCFDKLMKLLDMLKLKDDDTLFVLGDLTDRGPENVKVITTLAARKNVVALKGNHDYTAALMLQTFGMGERGNGSPLYGKPGAEEVFEAWLADGGDATWKEFEALNLPEKEVVLRYLKSLPLFTELEISGQAYHLSHTVPPRALMLDPKHRAAGDFLFGHPDYDKVYYDDRILVTGHTPTGLIAPAFAGRILRKNNHIAIDCGAVFGNPLGCICLETGEEYYAE